MKITSEMRMTPKMKMTSKIKTTPKNKYDPKIEDDLYFSVAKVWKRNFPPYSSFGIGYTKTGIRYVSCCYEVIPKPFQGKHVCCNNSCSNQSIEKILSDSFYIYLAWILGKVSATKSKKNFCVGSKTVPPYTSFGIGAPPFLV